VWPEQERRLQDVLATALGCRVRVAVAGGSRDALRMDLLTAGELARYRGLAPWTAQPWLAGRAALKRLLVEQGRDPDTSRLSFPDRRFSLTHAGDVALAVAVDVDESLGVGVDLERGLVDPGAARFFLRLPEIHWLRQEALAQQPAHAQRLWTVKEAVFKADAANHDGLLVDYELMDPSAWQGAARHGNRGAGDVWHYVTTETPWGLCTLAVQPGASAAARAEEATC
jgi:hypothetical protein